MTLVRIVRVLAAWSSVPTHAWFLLLPLVSGRDSVARRWDGTISRNPEASSSGMTRTPGEEVQGKLGDSPGPTEVRHRRAASRTNEGGGYSRGGLAMIFRVRNDRSAMAESFGLRGRLYFVITITL
jgi:hypothetical protein